MSENIPSPYKSKKTLTILTSKKAKPIGMPIVKRKKRETNMAKRIIHHSIAASYPSLEIPLSLNFL